MSQDSNLGVYIFVGLLITVLVSAVPIIAADRTVFDSAHAAETIEDEDVYSQTTVAFQQRVTELVAEAPAGDADGPLLSEAQRARIAETAVTESYVEAELGGHIERAYSYLNGDRDDAQFVFDLSEPKARAIEEARIVEREARAQQDSQITSPDAVPADQLVIGPYLSAEFDDSQNITRGGAVPGELDTARTAAAVFGILWWLLPVIAVGLLGLIYYVTGRSVRKTAGAAGSGLVAAGLLGLIGGLGGRPIARSLAEGRLELENPAFESLSDGLVALVGSLFDLVLIQSGVLFLLGILVLGVVSAEANGFFDSLTGGADTEAASDRSQGRDSQATRRTVPSERSETTDTTETNSEIDSEYSRDDSPETEGTTAADPGADTATEYDPEQYDEHGFKVEDDSEERR